jgi:transposase
MSTDGRFYDLGDRDQPRLFAPSLREAVADDADVLALDAAVEQLDLSTLEARYGRVGHPAYPPGVMVKVLLYGYAIGLRASRQIDRACRRDDAFRFLAAGLTPDFRTLCRFRREHPEALRDLFAQTVVLCQQAGLVLLEHVAVDGTKLRADRSRRGLGDVREAVRAALAAAEAADGDIPAASSEEATASSRRDDDCRFMKTSEGLQPAYNAQLAVDAAHQVIVAQEVVAAPTDGGQLPAMVEQIAVQCGVAPQAVSADGGYFTEAAVAALDGVTEVHLPGQQRGLAGLTWEEAEQAYRCPAGQLLRRYRVRRGRQIYRTTVCRGCPHAPACGVRGRTREVHLPLADRPLGRLRQRMQQAAGQAIYAARKRIIEPVFGWLKHNRGLRRLLVRGLSGARAEWALACIAHNLRVWALSCPLPFGRAAQIWAIWCS